MSFPSGTRVGPYEITAPIGAGGMGAVYRAHDSRLGRDVAIKVLPPAFTEDPERLRRFEQEAKTLASLSHPNILAIHDVGTHAGSPYLVMELLEGATLRDFLSNGALPMRQAVDLALQIARGLSAAHAKGLVHRDVKPANLFITQGGNLKILDFGLAKQALLLPGPQSQLPTQDAIGLTLEGLALGTVGYMSPEQVEGRSSDARSDLFAFGVVLYEMLSGRRAFERDSVIETMSATLKEDPPELDSPVGPLPASLLRLVSRCLEKDPGRRFQGAQELAQNLERILVESASAPSPTVSRRLRRFLGPRPWALPLAALVLVATGGGTLLIKAWPRPVERPPQGIPSVVALPTRVLGSDQAAFLTDAIPDTLSTLLAGVEGLEMKIPPSSTQVEKVKGDLERIAEAYRVKHLLLTTVTAQGEGLILNVKLVECPSQKVRWAGQYEGRRATYNALLREAAEGVARALRPGLGGFLAGTGSAPTSEAELALKEGQHYAARFVAYNQRPDFDRAKDAFERALKAEPTSAQALGDLAYLWVFRAWKGAEDTPSCIAQAERRARQALALDPRTAVAWAALAQAEIFKQPTSLEKLLEYSIQAANPKAHQPDYGVALGGSAGGPILMAAGGIHAFERKPLEPTWGGMGATGLTLQGRPKEALHLLDRVLAVEPGFRFGLVAKAEALVGLGRLKEAGDLLKRCEPPDSDQHWQAEFWREVQFELAVARGDTATANALADRAARLWLGPGSTNIDINAPATMPPGLVKLGRPEEALRMLELGMTLLPNAEGYLSVLYHPDMRPQRGDPRYQRLVEQGKKDLALALRMLQEARAHGELPPSFDGTLAELRGLQNRTP